MEPTVLEVRPTPRDTTTAQAPGYEPPLTTDTTPTADDTRIWTEYLSEQDARRGAPDTEPNG